ncbi:MAG: M3 family oligoendopeptidase [Candidatus Heimdallarchaeota archaeon]|nr:M3 family oligoendopeptidase [Candidatus Heimdallarchaeota archaeon]MBY8994546.1 M3 family oligoendopeptidase [Candidatus Heimdallarchaeota archaeon]
MTKPEIAWDLSVVFPSVTDPSIEKAIEFIQKAADDLVTNYQGKIIKFSSKELLKLLQDYEIYLVEIRNLGMFARLTFAGNMTIPESQKLNDRVSKLQANLSKKLAFMNLEIGKLVHSKPELITDATLVNYKHYLERLKRAVPHQLSEVEEQLIIEKDQFGLSGWSQLQSKWLNTRIFEVEVEGEKKKLPYGKANSLLPHPDRATRKSANQAIYQLLKEDGELFTSALRNITNDWINVTKRRKYDSEMHASLIANDIDQKTIDSLLKTIDESSHIYRRYLQLKAKLLGLPKLANYDIVAPLPDAPDITYDYEKAKELCISAYSKFDEEYAFGTKDMFEKNRVDASARFGKRSGAFCSSWFKGQSAFILQSYNDSLSGVYTLAHELGHATHDYYFTREQTILNTSIPMIVAETASIFGELLITDLLLSQAQSDKEKIAIISRVLDGAGMAAFQVTARAWFEQDMYDAINRGEFLDYETISEFWTKNRDRIYGDAIEWLDVMDAEWTMKGHYYMANFRFYNYPYVYGQLFVYALYQKYLEDEKDFIPKFKKVLAAGSSVSPKEIGDVFGLDISDPEFWKLGIKRFKYFVDEFEKLLK